jgi:hypothetical protein
VSNKDVILQISIAVFICVLIVPQTIYSRTEKRITGATVTCYSNNNTIYDSYENYIPARKGDPSRTSVMKQKKGSDKKRPPGQTIKQTPEINKKSRNCRRYTVRKGDTLTSIAKKSGVTVSSLRSLNKLTNQHRITKGMIITIPSKQASSSPVRKTELKNGITAPLQNKPRFLWPIKTVIDYHNDGLNGVKSIGIIITAKPGSTVLSSASGTVIKIGRMRGFGNYIVINHSGRYSTVYANLDMILVSQGETVPAGNAIGKISTTEQKMHFQIDREGKPEDPLHYLPGKI